MHLISVLDFCQGYHQVTSKKVTKTIMHLPFGRCNSSPAFQKLMVSVLSGLLWNVFFYTDDVIVFSETDQVKRPVEVLKRFRDSDLKPKAQK